MIIVRAVSQVLRDEPSRHFEFMLVRYSEGRKAIFERQSEYIYPRSESLC